MRDSQADLIELLRADLEALPRRASEMTRDDVMGRARGTSAVTDYLKRLLDGSSETTLRKQGGGVSVEKIKFTDGGRISSIDGDGKTREIHPGTLYHSLMTGLAGGGSIVWTVALLDQVGRVDRAATEMAPYPARLPVGDFEEAGYLTLSHLVTCERVITPPGCVVYTNKRELARWANALVPGFAMTEDGAQSALKQLETHGVIRRVGRAQVRQRIPSILWHVDGLTADPIFAGWERIRGETVDGLPLYRRAKEPS